MNQYALLFLIMTSQDSFKDFMNKKIKVVYKEFENLQIGRGILTSVDKKFLTLDGDFSYQVIPIESIIRISCMKSSQGKDQDESKRR